MGKEEFLTDADMVESTTNGGDEKSLGQMDCTTNGFVDISDRNSDSKEVIRPWEIRGDHTVQCIYRQDIVRLKKDESLVGLVTEVAGDMDSDSDITEDDTDEEDDDENADGNNDENDTAHDAAGEDDEKGSEDGNGRKGHDNKDDPLPPDQVRVMWLDHSETTHNISDVTVVDRALLYGDVVAAASDRTGQVGVVLDVNIFVDLLAADGFEIKDVSSKDLKRVRDFTVGDYVVLGPWLGRVDEVLDNVTVLFDDGSMCKVMKADPLRLKPVSKNILEDENFPYYPGQRVKASSSSVFKNARWLSGLWKASRLEGTVTKVTVGTLFIYWIASAGCGSESATTPAEEQSPKNLKILSCLAHANWQVGDRCFLPSPALSSFIPSDKNSSRVKSEDPTDGGSVSSELESEHGSEGVPLERLDEGCPSLPSIESMDLDSVPKTESLQNKTSRSQEPGFCRSSMSATKEPLHENWLIHRKKMRKVVRRDKKSRKKEENFERALVIVNTKTRVDVSWQDGKTELGIVSTSLVPIDNPGDQEFVPEQYVVEKASDEDDDACEVKHVGVVKSVNAKERTACVRWLKPVAKPEDPREFDKEEVVSVYGLERHPDYDYCNGDVVVRLSPVSVSTHRADPENLVEEPEQASSNGDKWDPNGNVIKELENASKDETYADFSDLSWVGNITGLKDGDIEVTWADGMVSTVGPQAIYVVGRDDDDESLGAGSEISDDDGASWETVNEDEMDTHENAEEEDAVQNANNVILEAETTVNPEDNSSGRDGPLSIPLAALGFVTRLASELFLRGRRQIDPSYGQSPGTVDDSDTGASAAKFSSQEPSAIDKYADEDAEEDGQVSVATDTTVVIESDESVAGMMHPCSFKHFDTAKDPLDHFFLGTNGQSNNDRKWLRKVQQDWSILQKNLPDSIYVRVYEDRMDLLRAVIVGAYGTPYQDGLFFFDFQLPPEYPQAPPSAHYHSGGWRLNPNLYEEGKVCLSLLNTWTGKGNEVWDPASSSILQVLVSLQGLVLNSKPYFNEAGYDRQVGTAEGEKNSLSYNENTFLLNCKSMMLLLRKPPKDFEELIKDHFRRRGYYILKACDAYMKGFSIGSLTEDASLSDTSNENSTSVGFKLMLAKLTPKLFTALDEVGADVQQFKHLQQS